MVSSHLFKLYRSYLSYIHILSYLKLTFWKLESQIQQQRMGTDACIGAQRSTYLLFTVGKVSYGTRNSR